MAEGEEPPRSFFRGTTGIITAVAGLITAVAALLGALAATGVLGGDPDERATPVQTVAARPIATCDPTALIDIVKRAVERDVVGVRIAGGTVQACRKDYALVRVEADPSLCEETGACFDPVNVFLRIIRDEWQVMDVGSGISCDNPDDLYFALREACRALGLPRT